MFAEGDVCTRTHKSILNTLEFMGFFLAINISPFLHLYKLMADPLLLK